MRSDLCALICLLWLAPSAGFAPTRPALSATHACENARVGRRAAPQMAVSELKTPLAKFSSAHSWGASIPEAYATDGIALAGFPTTPIGGVAQAVLTVPTGLEATDSTAPAVSSLSVAAFSDPVRRALSGGASSDADQAKQPQLTPIELALLVISAGGAAATPFLCPWLIRSAEMMWHIRIAPLDN
jgi:hypothetical protein